MTFVIHKSLLCFHSPYFEKAFTRDWKESTTKAIDVVETSHEAFGLLAHWIYHQEIPFDLKELMEKERDQDRFNDLPRKHYDTLVDLWILGDRFFMPAVQNLAIDAMEYQKFWTKAPIPQSLYEKIYGTLFGKEEFSRRGTFSLFIFPS
jgi:hypothetical protein